MNRIVKMRLQIYEKSVYGLHFWKEI